MQSISVFTHDYNYTHALTWTGISNIGAIQTTQFAEVRVHGIGSSKEDRGSPSINSHSLIYQVDSTKLFITTLSFTCMHACIYRYTLYKNNTIKVATSHRKIRFILA